MVPTSLNDDDDDLMRERRAWRDAGETVVLTNGCFDLLHAGHIHLLQAARGQGDHLIVAINSDRSVQALKGAGRPIVSEEERSEVLLALEVVDRVLIYDDETPARVIERLLPDVLVKGADWAMDAIVGREAVEAAGGRVVRIEILPDRSTSRIVEQIRRS